MKISFLSKNRREKCQVPWRWIVTIGKTCLDCSDCPHYNDCKLAKDRTNKIYKKLNKFKIFSILKICIVSDSRAYSGTKYCPHNLPKNYTCYDCCYSYINRYGESCCSCQQHLEDIKNRIDTSCHDEIWGSYNKCKYFKLFNMF